LELPQQNGYQPNRGQVTKRYEIVINGKTYTADSDADARALIDQLTKAKLSY